jgi:hypothetical protein
MRKIFPILLFPVLLWGRDSWYAIGPMFHLNFGNGKVGASLALEWSYWSYDETYESANVMAQQGFAPGPEGRGYGFDVGVEWEFLRGEDKLRLYTEAQTGWKGAMGLSLGPVLEVLPDFMNPRLGIQGSGWLLPGDLRLRYIDHKAFICPGIFIKIPAN